MSAGIKPGVNSGLSAAGASEHASPRDCQNDQTPNDPAKIDTAAFQSPVPDAGAQSFHVAIIMDGNGRWARARGLPRIAGHRQGVEAVREIVKACPDLGVTHLTLYAFSTENWRRPPLEVMALMDLFRLYLRREANALVRDGVRVVFIGDPSPLDQDLRAMMAQIEARTAGNSRLTIAIALNYGARSEMVQAARSLAEQVAQGTLAPEDITEARLGAALYTGALPDPDLIIRTSGEQRLSNFLLWQCAYSEFVFAPEAWPDFTPAHFARAIGSFSQRERRYGAVSG
ncbi:MAG: isoprenyl transferase [Neomegalonema sp.]|nr:isoprenyl transferase [Neomegalonema sp.]